RLPLVRMSAAGQDRLHALMATLNLLP
ncbi:MAG: hypothetical protein RL648_1695, partial [Verrucomicrobiota bacterium]